MQPVVSKNAIYYPNVAAGLKCNNFYKVQKLYYSGMFGRKIESNGHVLRRKRIQNLVIDTVLSNPVQHISIYEQQTLNQTKRLTI